MELQYWATGQERSVFRPGHWVGQHE
ncbi:hypothetical protein [Mycolicibacterium thermoresistibile]